MKELYYVIGNGENMVILAKYNPIYDVFYDYVFCNYLKSLKVGQTVYYQEPNLYPTDDKVANDIVAIINRHNKEVESYKDVSLDTQEAITIIGQENHIDNYILAIINLLIKATGIKLASDKYQIGYITYYDLRKLVIVLNEILRRYTKDIHNLDINLELFNGGEKGDNYDFFTKIVEYQCGYPKDFLASTVLLDLARESLMPHDDFTMWYKRALEQKPVIWLSPTKVIYYHDQNNPDAEIEEIRAADYSKKRVRDE